MDRKQAYANRSHDETLSLANDIFKAKAEIQEMERELIDNLVENNMTDYFSINWRRLRQTTR